MTTIEVEQASQPVEPLAVEPYTPRPVSTWTVKSRTWIPHFEILAARRWTFALAGALLVSVVGIGLLYQDDTNNQATIRALTLHNESLTGRNLTLEDQLRATQTNLTASLGELAKTKAELEHPHLSIWNVPQQIKGSTWYLAGGIPDTFTYHLQATSTGPMSISILTFEQFGQAIACVNNGAGSTNYCMHHRGTVQTWPNVTSINYDFHDSEGCADYMAVFTSGSTITVTPNVTVTYNPANHSTGACA
jgi:hypothetical protein